MRAVATILFALVLAAMPAVAVAQQGGTTRFVYDDNGRLRAVISPTGEAAVYEYDRAGNFTAIRRLAATALELLDFFPKEGLPDDLVTFLGVGFGDGVNSVSFNGSTAQVIETTVATVVARVPQGATTGPVTIVTPRGTVTTAVPFTIKGVRVTPSTARIFPGDSVQFTAFVAGSGSDQSVTWSVNGIDGGSAAVGTITAAGLYTAPNQHDPSILVRATSVVEPFLFGQAIVNVQDLNLVKTAIAPLISVRRATPAEASALASLVSVQRAIPPSASALAALVSVQRATPPSASALAPLVSVRLGSAQNPTQSVEATGVSVTTGPYISNISPGAFVRGASAAVAINGINLSGAPALTFYTTDGAIDSSITVSDLTVNGAGTSITATLTVSSGAAIGRRIVVVSVSAVKSQIADLGTNTIEITQ